MKYGLIIYLALISNSYAIAKEIPLNSDLYRTVIRIDTSIELTNPASTFVWEQRRNGSGGYHDYTYEVFHLFQNGVRQNSKNHLFTNWQSSPLDNFGESCVVRTDDLGVEKPELAGPVDKLSFKSSVKQTLQLNVDELLFVTAANSWEDTPDEYTGFIDTQRADGSIFRVMCFRKKPVTVDFLSTTIGLPTFGKWLR